MERLYCWGGPTYKETPLLLLFRNMIGHYYWLFRFLGQYFFYSLVLLGVCMQIYHYEEERVILGVFIATIATSAVFLWLEFIQLMRDRKGYIRYVPSSLKDLLYTSLLRIMSCDD